MSEIIFSTDEYIRSPEKHSFNININSQHLICFKKFLPIYSNPFFIQWRNIKRAAKSLIKDGVLSHFPIHIIPSLKQKAYIIDGGGMYFSLGLLISHSSPITLTVFCHELSHMWLSQQEFYPELKQLNKDFLNRYKQEPTSHLISPIEFYATTLSVDIMDRIYDSLKKKNKRFEKALGREREKVILLRKSILAL